MNAKMIIEIIFIIAFLLMAYSFANLAAGRRKRDAQIIEDLKNENDDLNKKENPATNGASSHLLANNNS